MARPEKIPITKHISIDDLNNEIKNIDGRIKDLTVLKRMSSRLNFVRLRYSGYSVTEASGMVDASIETGYNWQELWNSGGMDALTPKFAGGRRSKLTDGQLSEIKTALNEPMSTRGLRFFIKERYGIEYTDKQVRKIAKKLVPYHAKPYPEDYRRPADSAGILKKT